MDRGSGCGRSTAAVLAIPRSSGMRVTGRPGHEITLCEPDPDNPCAAATWNDLEYLAATGSGPSG